MSRQGLAGKEIDKKPNAGPVNYWKSLKFEQQPSEMHRPFSLHPFLHGGRRLSRVALCQLPPPPSSHLPLRTIQGNRRPHDELQICGFPAKVQSTWDLYARTKCILIHDTFKITIIDGKKGVDMERERY